MLVGNKDKAKQDILSLTVEALRSAYAGTSQVPWDSKTYNTLSNEINSAAQSITDMLTDNMKNLGDVPYIKGNITKIAIRYAADYGLLFFKNMSIGPVGTRRGKQFGLEFSKKLSYKLTSWNQESLKYFPSGRARKGERNECA